MKRRSYKSSPLYINKKRSVELVKETGLHVIKDIVIVQSGIDKYGELIDEEFIDGIVEQGNAHPVGIKCRFGHPEMCNTTLGTEIGRFKNFRAIDDSDGKYKAIADLHLIAAAKKAPGKNYYDWVIQMSDEAPDMFGNSIVFIANAEPEIVEVETEGENGTETVDREVPRLILLEFLASDLVDSPAATDNLFKSTDDLGLHIKSYLDENPEMIERLDIMLEKNPELVTRYITGYLDRNKSKSKSTNKTMATKTKKQKQEEAQEKLKELRKTLGMKDIDLTTTDGKVLTVETDADQPAVGDPVSMDGQPAADGDYNIDDGSMITVADGKIEAVTPADTAAAEDDSEKEMKRLREENTQLKREKTELTKQVGQQKSQLDTAKQQFRELQEQMRELSSGGEPSKEQPAKNNGQEKIGNQVSAKEQALKRKEDRKKEKDKTGGK